jgi:hypothetical protein
VAQQMTIGLGIALGALCLRVSSLLDKDTHGGFSVANFRCAFAVAAVLVLVSVIGYANLPRDAGDAVRG